MRYCVLREREREREMQPSALLYAFTFLASLLAPWLRQTDVGNFSRELPTYESFFVAGWLMVRNFRSSTAPFSFRTHLTGSRFCTRRDVIRPITVLMTMIEPVHAIASSIGQSPNWVVNDDYWENIRYLSGVNVQFLRYCL